MDPVAQRLMTLYTGNDRFYGSATKEGSRFDNEKNKWIPGNIKTVFGKITPEIWEDHIAGRVLLGVAPLLDDGKTLWASLDLDDYGINTIQEIRKIKDRIKLPVVIDQSKSGGLHLKLFFCEPVDGELARKVMMKIRAMLGYGNCEIFPKQTSYHETEKAGSWMFVVYGSTWDMFQLQTGLNDSGGSLTMEQYVVLCENSRVSTVVLVEFLGKPHSSMNGHSTNGHANGGLKWVEPGHNEGIASVFHDGPPCLEHLTQHPITHYQNNCLVMLRSFFQKKYPDDWEEAFNWANYRLLQPVGTEEKKKSLLHRKDKRYNYTCHEIPMVDHCDSKTCRTRKFGVGAGEGGRNDYWDMGLVMMRKVPAVYFANVGNSRLVLKPDDLQNVRSFRRVCLENGEDYPEMLKQPEWDKIVKHNMQTMTIIEPYTFLQTHAEETALLISFLDSKIIYLVREKGNEFLNGLIGDDVRIKDGRVHFKEKPLMRFCEYKMKSVTQIDRLKHFLSEKGRKSDKNHTGFFRFVWSLPLDMFEEEVTDKWLGKEEGEGDE